MAKSRCRHCKKKFEPTGIGRRPSYCSVACRQGAYRKRLKESPMRAWLRVVEGDLFAIQDRTARGRGAVKVLEDLGYDVYLTKRPGPVKPGAARKAQLTLVDNTPGEVGDASEGPA